MATRGKKVNNFSDAALLLDPNRVMEASKEFGNNYNSAYDNACKYALNSIIKCGKLEEKICLLNGVIKEQEEDIKRLESEIKKFIKDSKSAAKRERYVQGQIDGMRAVLKMLDSNYE